jgi:hypothetical protein
MRVLTFVATALCLVVGSVAMAGEPLRLDDESLDRVSAGLLDDGVALGWGSAYSTGRFGGSASSTFGRVQNVQVIENGQPFSDTRVNAGSSFAGASRGPGATAAGGFGGVYMRIF